MKRAGIRFVWLAAWLLFGFFSQTAGAAAELPKVCRTGCTHPFGQVLGETAGHVRAYSNCRAECVVPIPHRVDDTFTGIKWQCVEFARRWLLRNRGVVYADVDVAADIWDRVDHVKRPVDGVRFRLASFPNGADQPPRTGDLLIYSRRYLGTGHVAVVTRVKPREGFVEVAEQNYRNEAWPGKYARRIPIAARGGGYWLDDPYLLGWKRIED